MILYYDQTVSLKQYCIVIMTRYMLMQRLGHITFFLDTQVSLAPTHVSPSISCLVILLNLHCP